MNGQIIQGDCLEVMRTLPEQSVDMVLCDLPYGTTCLEWDTPLDLSEFWQCVHRVAKKGAIIAMTAQQPFTTDVINANRKNFKYEWIWEKNRPMGFLGANKKPLAAHENILVFANSKSIYNPQKEKMTVKKVGRRSVNSHYHNCSNPKGETHSNNGLQFPRTVLRFSNHNANTVHPTQKPVSLFEYLIRTYTNEGDTVLDPTAGSGTTGVACEKSKRKYILIELSPAYIQIIELELVILAGHSERGLAHYELSCLSRGRG